MGFCGDKFLGKFEVDATNQCFNNLVDLAFVDFLTFLLGDLLGDKLLEIINGFVFAKLKGVGDKLVSHFWEVLLLDAFDGDCEDEVFAA